MADILRDITYVIAEIPMDPVNNGSPSANGPPNVQSQNVQNQNVQSQSAAVDEFVDLARDKLDSDGLFQWVDSGEVVDVNNALVALGNDHGPDAADAALDKLADEGLLDTFVAEMYGAGRGGSVSADNRETIFTNIARYADGETAARFAQSLESSTNGADGYDRMQDFADTVATHATPQSKVDFIESLAPLSTDGRSADFRGTFSGVTSSIEGDTDAAAIATVLGSLQGTYAQEALDSLSTEQLDAVVNASIKQTTTTVQGSVTGSFDASNFTALADVVAQYGSVEQKAQVFDTAGKRVDSVADGSSFLVPATGTSEAAADITNGLTQILTSDTNAVVEELTYDRRFDDGRAMTNYVEQLIETGQNDKVASIQVQLMLGNAGDGVHSERFNQVDSNGVATNAGKIGFFSGAVQNAVDNIDATNKEKQAAVLDIIGTTSSILGGTVGLAFPGVKGASFVIGQGGNAAKRVVDQVLDTPRANIDELIIDMAIPFDPVTNNVDRTSIAFSEFQDIIDQVENANRRNGG